jgi:hypothetical protein
MNKASAAAAAAPKAKRFFTLVAGLKDIRDLLSERFSPDATDRQHFIASASSGV